MNREIFVEKIAEKDWSIVTDSREKAETIINTILTIRNSETVEKKIVCKDSINVLFSDGTKLRWYKPLINSIRGMKCSKLWCDKYAKKDVLEWLETCYFGNVKDIIWI